MKNPRERRIWFVFWAGMLSGIALASLRQDWYGLEGYIEILRFGWVSAWVTVPIALVILAVSFLIIRAALYNKWDVGGSRFDRRRNKRPLDPQPDDY